MLRQRDLEPHRAVLVVPRADRESRVPRWESRELPERAHSLDSYTILLLGGVLGRLR